MPEFNWTTHAITITPWMTFGHDCPNGPNAGWVLQLHIAENLLGCHVRNADEIVPEWQGLKIGYSVWLHPQVPPVELAALDPGRALLLKGWGAFVLQPIGKRTTRLIIRSQGDYNPDLGNFVFNFLLW